MSDDVREPLIRTADEQAVDDAFLALYGDWDPLTPSEVAKEFNGFERPWWVVGGWAIEAATGYRREHEDIDISILSTDVAALVENLRGRWHVWNNVGGVLHPARHQGLLVMRRTASRTNFRCRWPTESRKGSAQSR